MSNSNKYNRGGFPKWASIVIGCVITAVVVSLIAVAVGQQNNATENTSKNTTVKPAAKPVVTTKTETKTKSVPYEKKSVYDNSMAKGKKYVSKKGVNGKKTYTYEVTYTDGKETSRKLIKEKVTKKPVTQVTRIGTYVKPAYTGYCAVEGTYRNRYARCYGNYSPSAKRNAESKAYECNVNTRAVQGCYNTYR